MKRTMVRIIALVVLLAVLGVCLASCAWFESQKHALKGSLIGVSYSAEFFDNYGALFMTATGQNIDITGNKLAELGFDSTGSTITTYSLSSVLTITIDGKEMQSCGNSIIFAESGLTKDVDFTLNDIESSNDGSWTNLTSVAKVIKSYRNAFGKSRVVVIQSQLGVPICAYSGDEVYWEIPNDLPKMTKLMIDGKALYVHRVNFQIIDLELLK